MPLSMQPTATSSMAVVLPLRYPLIKCVQISGDRTVPPDFSFSSFIGKGDRNGIFVYIQSNKYSIFLHACLLGYGSVPGFMKIISSITHVGKGQALFSTVNHDMVAKSPFVAFCSTESEKCHFHFPCKSMTYVVGH